MGNATGVELYTKVGWASWVGLAHVGMRLLPAGYVDSKDARPCDQRRPVVTLGHHHVGGVVCVNTAGQKAEGARRGSAW